MVTCKKLQTLALLLVLLLFGGYFRLSWAQSDSPPVLDANRIRWSHLVYSALSRWVDVKVDVRLEQQSKATMQAELPANRQGDAIPVPDAGGYRLTTDIATDAAFKPPVHKKNHVWFIPHDGTALGRLRLRQGKDDFKKVYRFTGQGVFRHRQEPKNKQEALLKPEKWTDIADTFYSYTRTQPGCANVTDRLLLVYIASAAGMQANSEPLSVCVFGKRKLFRVRLKPAGTQAIQSEFAEINRQTEIRRQGLINALKIDFEVQQLTSDSGIDENFSFLGLRKNISIFIEPATNLPIQIRGDIPSVGKAVLSLQSARVE
ncbi:MAG: DUF3108 domain-containing protein [bacterium]|nr:DUF3108 domain-containing protein [bacterium]